ncbi:LysR family transcriptional regulator [Rheinheimera mesophila]|uniref:LysR family transcriptional regulator n=1 Tax=Rheinheimera mesophila TaxID=1547515 RepID=A0A3P3QE84_9GAMM|nr:LysR family transcriptional regulator [Rheinheimera mesophila]KKL03088.1 LysR family transcriptional regulator [Rheinheimera mesophila]RRJ19502.1 LysR family transcriptional regulator [Rheinheimera mesophila]
MANHPILTLDALRAMDAIDRKGSFAAAAEHLYKVPSALSYTIAKLESDLDVQLFDRSKQKAQLTPAGQLLLQQGRELLQAASRLQDAIKQVDTGWETQFVIAKDSIVPYPPVLSLINEFMQLGKMTEVSIREEVLGGGWEALETGRAQIAIGVSADMPKGKYELVPIGEVEFVFALSPLHELANINRQIELADVEQETAIVVSDSALDAPKRSTGLFATRRVLRVSSMQAKIAAQVQGVGVGFLPKHLIRDELARGLLIAKKTSIPRDKSMLYLAWQKQGQGKALQWFSEAFSQYSWAAVWSENPLRT